MKPFDLEAAKNNARVCRCDGKIVHFVGKNANGQPVFHDDGKYFATKKDGGALHGLTEWPTPSVFLAPDPVPTRRLWVQLIRVTASDKVGFISVVRKTAHDARELAKFEFGQHALAGDPTPIDVPDERAAS